jgi:hypothetical protein
MNIDLGLASRDAAFSSPTYRPPSSDFKVHPRGSDNPTWSIFLRALSVGPPKCKFKVFLSGSEGPKHDF